MSVSSWNNEVTSSSLLNRFSWQPAVSNGIMQRIACLWSHYVWKEPHWVYQNSSRFNVSIWDDTSPLQILLKQEKRSSNRPQNNQQKTRQEIWNSCHTDIRNLSHREPNRNDNTSMQNLLVYLGELVAIGRRRTNRESSYQRDARYARSPMAVWL